MSHNEWSEYRLLLLDGLEEVKVQQERMLEKLNTIEKEIAVLKFKSGLWGTLAGAIAAITAMLLKKGT
jgi:hypothetical protein